MLKHLVLVAPALMVGFQPGEVLRYLQYFYAPAGGFGQLLTYQCAEKDLSRKAQVHNSLSPSKAALRAQMRV